jgi:glycosyltransferase involved in cell wall biosynthesis
VGSPKRLAIIVSHPIQYYAPLYQRLAQRNDLTLKVFFTWHSGNRPIQDPGFKMPIEWDLRLTDGYESEVVSNQSPAPGMHHFFGLVNPSLARRVVAWSPDVVHVTGWAWCSHFFLMRRLHLIGIPVLFRGDSHLLDSPSPSGLGWSIKKALLTKVFSWPRGFLVVGTANRDYYERLGVGPDRLYPCVHSIDVGRFSDPSNSYEREASAWRKGLEIPPEKCVLLFAGKFEERKRPIELMRAVNDLANKNIMLIVAGNGELDTEVRRMAASNPERFRVLPFQNQERMPVIYRIGDLFVLPSAYNETWGLAVNEALAAGRPVLVSDRVGCAKDVVEKAFGRIFSWQEPASLPRSIEDLTRDKDRLTEMRKAATQKSWSFDISRTEDQMMAAVFCVCSSQTS